MIQKAFELAGDQNKYQKRTLILLCLVWVCYMIAAISSPYLFMDPIFECQNLGPELHLKEETCTIMNSCPLKNNFILTAQNGLYCQQKWLRIMIQSSYAVGAFLGMFLVNILADIKGRKNALILSLTILIIGTLYLIYGGLMSNPTIVIMAQFLRGLGSQPIWVLGTVFIAQFFGDHIRPKSLITMQSVGGLVFLIMGYCFHLEMHWLNFLIFIQVVPAVVALTLSCLYLHQSPHYLMNRNELKRAQQILIQIAKYNDREAYVEDIQELFKQRVSSRIEQKMCIKITGQKQQTKQSEHSLIQVFQVMNEWGNMKNIILLSAVVIIAQMNYFGINYCFSQIGMGYSINNYIMFIAQTGSIFISNPIIASISRKKGLVSSWGAVALFGFLYLIPSVKNNLIISTILVGIIRVFSACGASFIGCVATQVFKSKIQSTAFGIIETIGIIGIFAAPFVIQMSDYFGIHPFSGFSIAICLVIWTPYFLKYQRNQSKFIYRQGTQRKSFMQNCPGMLFEQTINLKQKGKLQIELLQISTKTSL